MDNAMWEWADQTAQEALSANKFIDRVPLNTLARICLYLAYNQDVLDFCNLFQTNSVPYGSDRIPMKATLITVYRDLIDKIMPSLSSKTVTKIKPKINSLNQLVHYHPHTDYDLHGHKIHKKDQIISTGDLIEVVYHLIVNNESLSEAEHEEKLIDCRLNISSSDEDSDDDFSSNLLDMELIIASMSNIAQVANKSVMQIPNTLEGILKYLSKYNDVLDFYNLLQIEYIPYGDDRMKLKMPLSAIFLELIHKITPPLGLHLNDVPLKIRHHQLDFYSPHEQKQYQIVGADVMISFVKSIICNVELINKASRGTGSQASSSGSELSSGSGSHSESAEPISHKIINLDAFRKKRNKFD